MRKLAVLESDQLRRVLRREIARSHDAHLLHRLHCVLLVSEGFSCYQVASWFHEDPTTLERWVRLWNDHGTDRLRDRANSGRRPRLTPQQIEWVKLYVEVAPSAWGLCAPRWSGSVLRDFLVSQLAITLSLRQCQRLLASITIAGTITSGDEIQPPR